MASTSMSTRVFRGTLMLKPRYEGCSLSTLPASTQEMPVDCSAMITPTRPSMAQRECWSSHSRKRTMSNASLKGCEIEHGKGMARQVSVESSRRSRREPTGERRDARVSENRARET